MLDADDEMVQIESRGKFPGTFVRLAMDEPAKFGHKPAGYDSWGYPNASRYVRKLQSRRSLLAWKVFGRRLDGFSNDDHPSETEPGSRVLQLKGAPVDQEKNRSRWDLDYVGSAMPPAEAVAGTYAGPDGKKIKVEPLTDEDRRTIARWIDLGCPIDLDYDAAHPERTGNGWMLDENRPIVAITTPQPGNNAPIERLLVGMHDYGSGLDLKTFTVSADFVVDGAPAGTNLAPKFRETEQGVWELQLGTPIADLARGTLTLAVRDRQGNMARVARTFTASLQKE